MRVGFVGCGRHATNALYPALAPAGIELAAVCARDPEHAAVTARRFGAERWVGSVDELVALDDLDAVVVAVPPEAYAPIATRCLESGLPVFTEKPGAATRAEFERLTALSAERGVPMMVGYMKRFARGYTTAHRFVTDEAFGTVTSLHAKFVIGPSFGSLHGYLVDNPGHALDLLRMFGGEVVTCSARGRSLDGNRHAVALALEFASGAVGTAQLGTTASFFQDNELLEVIGDQHSVTVTNCDTVEMRRPTGPVEVDRPNYTVPLKQNFSGDVMGFVPELEHFREVVTDGVACRSDIASAARTFELVEQIADQLGAG